MIKLIACVSENGVIGDNGGIPWKYPGDLKRFKELTEGHAVIMGRKTWESIGKKSLPNRKNIIISKSTFCNDLSKPWMYCAASDAYFTHNLSFAFQLLVPRGMDAWIIGGGEIYKQCLLPKPATFVKEPEFVDITIVPEVIDSPTSIKFPFKELSGFKWQISHHKHPYNNKLKIVQYRRLDD